MRVLHEPASPPGLVSLRLKRLGGTSDTSQSFISGIACGSRRVLPAPGWGVVALRRCLCSVELGADAGLRSQAGRSGSMRFTGVKLTGPRHFAGKLTSAVTCFNPLCGKDRSQTNAGNPTNGQLVLFQPAMRYGPVPDKQLEAEFVAAGLFQPAKR